MMKIINKPWGKEEIVEINNIYMVKKLTMWKGHRCSLQYHNKKKETIYILTGKLRIYIGTSQKDLSSKIYGPNEFVTLPSGTIHRMEGVEDCEYLEASTPEMDDVVRLSDDYNRTKP
jgi:mannose-6-phosphate isomerase